MHTTKMPDERLVVHADPEIMSGVPVFLGTRVPRSDAVRLPDGWVQH